MAVKKRATYKHLGQVGHFKIAYKWNTNTTNQVKNLESIVILKGKTEIERGFKNFDEARNKAETLLKEYTKLRKNN